MIKTPKSLNKNSISWNNKLLIKPAFVKKKKSIQKWNKV